MGRDSKSREHIYQDKYQEQRTSFGKSRSTIKPSKSDMLAHNLCIFSATESCCSESKKNRVDKELYLCCGAISLNLANRFLSI